MKDLINKVEDFMFDFLGLILPGLLFIGLLCTPLLFIDSKEIPINEISDSKTLIILISLANYVNYILDHQTAVIIVLGLISSYILGHLIKVLSIILYDFLKAFFDLFINKLILKLLGIPHRLWKRLIIKIFGENNKFIKYVTIIATDLWRPFKHLIEGVFTFQAADYKKDNSPLKNECIKMINERFDTDYPNSWYSVYKYSTIMQQQENIKGLSQTFLAKYNAYRSLALIFIVILIYYKLFFNVSEDYLSSTFISLKNTILIAIFLFWFTFHTKYKRYWTLCGNDSLVSLFYYLKKTKT